MDKHLIQPPSDLPSPGYSSGADLDAMSTMWRSFISGIGAGTRNTSRTNTFSKSLHHFCVHLFVRGFVRPVKTLNKVPDPATHDTLMNARRMAKLAR